MKKAEIRYAEPYRTGGELFRVIIHQYDESQKLMWTYEVWATQEAIEDTLRLTKPMTKSDLSAFGHKIYEQRLRETNYAIPEVEGAFVTNESGIRYGDYRTFPGSMIHPDPLIQTNISLPTSLHTWLKIEAAKSKKSISELIRLALDDFRARELES